MKCLITAGPGYERIDQVRRITNFSTGSLGTSLAQMLARKGHEVLLLRGESAVCQAPLAAGVIKSFSTGADLTQQLEQAAREFHPDAVFHAAAISDFESGGIFWRDGTGELVAVQLAKAPSDQPLWVQLVPARKIIASLREWFPRAVLVGWKFEVDGSRAEAIAKARRQMESCRTNGCVANGPAYGEGFGLVTGGSVIHLGGPEALFEELARRVTKGV